MSMYHIATWTSASNGTAGAIFNNIPQTFTHLRMHCYLRASNVGAGANSAFWYNNDSGANYRVQYMGADGSSVFTGDFGSGQTYVNGGWVGNTAASAGIFSTSIIDIYDYSNAGKYKTSMTLNGFDSNNSTTNLLGTWQGLWLNTAAISRIDWGLQWAAGSRIDLYGISSSGVTGE